MDDWKLIDYENRLSCIEKNHQIQTDFQTIVWESTWMKLHGYQKEGIQWMYQLYQTGCGGVLADEMGKF